MHFSKPPYGHMTSPYKYLGALALLIAYGSLYPFEFSAAAPGAFLRLFSEVTLSGSIGDVLGNIGLFAPWGLVGILTIVPRRGMAVALVQTFAIGFVIAFGLQIAQVWVPTRTPALNDVFWNMVGCAVGVLLGHRFLSSRQILPGVSGSKQSIGFVLGAWIIWEWLPLVPSLDFQLVKDHLKDLLAFGSISFNLVFERIAISLLFGDLLSRLFTPRQSLILLPLLVTVIILGKLLLVDAQLSASIGLGFFVGILSWWAIYGISAESRSATIVVVLLLAYSVQALAPFSLKDAPSSFGWLPFEGLLKGSMLANIRSLGGNLLLFGSVLLQLRIAGSRIVVASVGLAVWVMIIELAQLFITTRSGAITEPLLVLIAGQFMGVLDFSVKGKAVENNLAYVAERRTRVIPPEIGAGGKIYPHLFTFVVLAFAIGMVTHLSFVPYNVRELVEPGISGILSVIGLSLAIQWLINGHFLFLSRCYRKHGQMLYLPFWLIAHGTVTWALLRLSVPMESIHDIVGAPVLGWIWEWELFGRYLALHWGIALQIIGAAVLLAVFLGKCRLEVFLTWIMWSALLAWPIHWIVVTGAATDNLIELMLGGGTLASSTLLASGFFFFFFAATAISNCLATRLRCLQTLLLSVLILILAIACFWFGTEQMLVKYGKAFSAWQFLLSPNREAYVSGARLYLHFALAFGTLLWLWSLVQAPVWKTLAAGKNPKFQVKLIP